MNLAEIIKTLQPRVYIRSGELVIQFSTPGDLIARVAETQAALSELERPELSRSDARTRGRTKGRSAMLSTEIRHGETTAIVDAEARLASAARISEGRED